MKTSCPILLTFKKPVSLLSLLLNFIAALQVCIIVSTFYTLFFISFHSSFVLSYTKYSSSSSSSRFTHSSFFPLSLFFWIYSFFFVIFSFFLNNTHTHTYIYIYTQQALDDNWMNVQYVCKNSGMFARCMMDQAPSGSCLSLWGSLVLYFSLSMLFCVKGIHIILYILYTYILYIIHVRIHPI